MNSSTKKKIAYLPEQISVTDIKASPLMSNGPKRYSLLSMGKKEQIVFQTPLFEKAMEMNKYDGYNDCYYVIPDNSDGKNMIEFILSLEKQIIDIIYKNKTSFFPNVDNVTFRSLIKTFVDNDDDSESKVIKFKIPNDTKTYVSEVETLEHLADATREKSSVQQIGDGHIRMIVNVAAIWLTDTMFGLYLKPICIEEVRIVSYEFEFQNGSCSIVNYIDSEIRDREKDSDTAEAKGSQINSFSDKKGFDREHINKHIGRILSKGKDSESDSDTSVSLGLGDN
jgi:hypothetical protein